MEIRDTTARRAALRIVIIYAAVAAAWIYCSDTIVGVFVRNPATMVRIAVAKGFLFIVVTAVLLYQLIHRSFAKERRTEKALAHERTFLRTLLNTIPDLVWLKDPDGVFLSCNRSFERLYGSPEGKIVGRTDYDFVDSEQADFFRRHDRAAMEAGRPSINEEWLTFREGGYRAQFETIKTPMVDGAGNLVGVLGTARDISSTYALRESEQKFRAISNSAQDAIVMIDENGLITFWNPAAERIFGYTAGEAVGQHAHLLLAPEWYHSQYSAAFDRFSKTGDSLAMGHAIELFALRKGGEEFPVEISLSSFNIGGRWHAASTIRDITERRKADEARDATVELLRICNTAENIRDLMQDLICYFQQITGCEAFGVRLRDGDNFPFFETVGLPEEFVRTESQLCSLDRDGAPRYDEAGSPVLDCLCGNALKARFDPEMSLTTRYGSFWTNDFTAALDGLDPGAVEGEVRGRCGREGYQSLALIPLKMHGETYGLVQFFDKRPGRFDPSKITLIEELVGYVSIALAKLTADDALQESSLYNRQIIDSAGEGIIVYGRDMRYRVWNPYMEQLSGMPAAEVLGRHVRDLAERFPFLEGAAVAERVAGVLAGNGPSAVDFPYSSRSGDRTGWVSDTCAPLRNTKGEIIGVIGTVRDITEQKRAEEELVRLNEELEQRVRQRTLEYEEANRELESFSYSVSHDMRAPLRHIEGFTRIFMEDHGTEISPEGRQYLDRICSSTRRMGEIIDALLKLSRISRRIICLEEVDLSGIAREIAADLRAASPEREVEFVVADGVAAHGDRQLFRVILDNLIGNAWKFTGKQEAARIEFGSESAEGVRAFFVRDNGAGFDAAYANKLLGVFQRLHRADEYEGTGVGLATVQRLVHRLGGRIWAEGEVGRGATFYFTIGV